MSLKAGAKIQLICGKNKQYAVVMIKTFNKLLNLFCVPGHELQSFRNL